MKLSDVVTKINGTNQLVAQGSRFWLETVIDIHIGRNLCENFGVQPKEILLEVVRKKLFEAIKKKHEKITKDKKAQQASVYQQKAKMEHLPPKKTKGKKDEENEDDESVPEIVKGKT